MEAKLVLLLSLYMSFLSFGVSAQYVSSQVLNGFGTTIITKSQTFDSSVGELASTTIAAGGYVITQGFLQPIDLKIPCKDSRLQAYPNPVLVEMTIFAEGCDIEVASFKTYDLFGKLVFEGSPVNNKINFSTVGVGVYFVRAFNVSKQEVGVVKILKSTI
jgi:type IX secretion system substrate protein